MLANHNARLKQFSDARGAIETALKLAPENRNVLFRASLVFEMIGDRKRALESLRKALFGGYSLEEVRQSEPLDALRQDPEYAKIEQDAVAARPETPCPITS
jgi:serine/threonine-protein kinase